MGSLFIFSTKLMQRVSETNGSALAFKYCSWSIPVIFTTISQGGLDSRRLLVLPVHAGAGPDVVAIDLPPIFGYQAISLRSRAATAPLQEPPFGYKHIRLFPLELLQAFKLHDSVVHRSYFVFLLMYVWWISFITGMCPHTLIHAVSTHQHADAIDLW
jgi:hypothetical protein